MDDNILKELLNEHLERIESSNHLKASDIPNIDLYMDQVTTFMDEHLGLFKRHKEDKVLTKTMINNYSKYKLLPPTVKKKYTNDHMILMLFIYYMKPILSITDINELLQPLQAIFINSDTHPEGLDSLKDFHDLLTNTESEHFDFFKRNMQETFSVAEDLFSQVEDTDQKELLTAFATAYFLTIQASAQKSMVLHMVDDYLKKKQVTETKSKTKSKPKK